MKTKRYIAWLLSIFSVIYLPVQSQNRPANPKTESIIDENTNGTWITLKQDVKINPEEVFSIHKKEFGLSDADEMRKIREHNNNITGIKIERYQQYVNGIKVYGAVTNLYSKNGEAIKTNGRFIKGIKADNSRSSFINENSALQKALDYLPEKNYAWNDAKREDRYKAKKKDPNASLYPKGELTYVRLNNDAEFKAENYTLCWKFEIAMNRSGSARVFVNAVTGKIEKKISLDRNCSGATVNLPFNGAQTIYASQQGRCSASNYYEAWDDCAVDIKVENDNFGSGSNDPICTTTSFNTWPSTLGGREGDALQVLWGMRKTYNWYNSRYGWNSYDDAGGSIDCTINYDFGTSGNPDGNNAHYTSFDEDFDFGWGTSGLDPLDSYTSLDIVAHEFTHGVDNFSADLDYESESGALNESFSDIFGEAIEQFTDLGIDNRLWLVAEDRGAIRSMQDPNTHDDPDTYHGAFWCYGQGYSCSKPTDPDGVHINSGVQNHFFYLLTEGGAGTNDNLDIYHVSGIGLADATDIAFTAHLYLWDDANYNDARDAWLEAAKDLFGNCSDQMIQVGNAWHAVGVGSSSPYNIKTIIPTTNVTAATAIKTLQAIQEVKTSGIVNINSISGSYEVRFYAGREVNLKPGFRAESGTAFRAKPNPCSITLHTAVRAQAPATGIFSQENSSARIEENKSGINVKASPNPFTETTSLEISLVEEEEISIAIFDATGKQLSEFDNKQLLPAGVHRINIDGQELTPGLYYAVITTSKGVKLNQRLSKVK